MTAATVSLGSVTAGCRGRLAAHYGPKVEAWLSQVPALLDAAAGRWDVTLSGYHDAGHASVLATGTDHAGLPVILKAWFDRDRYVREVAALRYWEPANGRVVLADDQPSAVALLAVVGPGPGGAPRPEDDVPRVARALARLHRQPLPTDAFPHLDGYLREEVAARICRRMPCHGDDIPLCVTRGRRDAVPEPTGRPAVLLHADLYRENVLFDDRGEPVFVDPLPMIGDPAFDWAFFAVYYDLADDPRPRLRAAAEISRIDQQTLLPWCRIQCLDGLLFYRETGDHRAGRMVEVMTALEAWTSRSSPRR